MLGALRRGPLGFFREIGVRFRPRGAWCIVFHHSQWRGDATNGRTASGGTSLGRLDEWRRLIAGLTGRGRSSRFAGGAAAAAAVGGIVPRLLHSAAVGRAVEQVFFSSDPAKLGPSKPDSDNEWPRVRLCVKVAAAQRATAEPQSTGVVDQYRQMPPRGYGRQGLRKENGHIHLGNARSFFPFTPLRPLPRFRNVCAGSTLNASSLLRRPARALLECFRPSTGRSRSSAACSRRCVRWLPSTARSRAIPALNPPPPSPPPRPLPPSPPPSPPPTPHRQHPHRPLRHNPHHCHRRRLHRRLHHRRHLYHRTLARLDL